MQDYTKLKEKEAIARGKAVKAVLFGGKSICVVSSRFGVHRCTIWRWIKRWKQINANVKTQNLNRPSRQKIVRESMFCWKIPTLSSAPHTHPRRVDTRTIRRILEIRDKHGRCAEVISYELSLEGVKVSSSAVKRILNRTHRLNKWSKWKKKRPHTERPLADCPGALVEVDTVHCMDQLTKKRKYITTVIDLYSRVGYAECVDRIAPGLAAKTVLNAQRAFGFRIETVQSDNGLEVSSYFSEKLAQNNIKHRHTRVRQPNDNAHIERFNRTLRQECIGNHVSSRLSCEDINSKLRDYLDYYNFRRHHMGIEFRTPISMLHR